MERNRWTHGRLKKRKKEKNSTQTFPGVQSIHIKGVKKSGAGQLGSKKNSLLLRKHTVLPRKIPTFMQ